MQFGVTMTPAFKTDSSPSTLNVKLFSQCMHALTMTDNTYMAMVCELRQDMECYNIK